MASAGLATIPLLGTLALLIVLPFGVEYVDPEARAYLGPAIVPVGVAAMAAAARQGPLILLRLKGQGGRLLQAYATQAVLLIVSVLVGAVTLGFAGGVWGIAIAEIVGAGYWWYVSARHARIPGRNIGGV